MTSPATHAGAPYWRPLMDGTGPTATPCGTWLRHFPSIFALLDAADQMIPPARIAAPGGAGGGWGPFEPRWIGDQDAQPGDLARTIQTARARLRDITPTAAALKAYESAKAGAADFAGRLTVAIPSVRRRQVWRDQDGDPDAARALAGSDSVYRGTAKRPAQRRTVTYALPLTLQHRQTDQDAAGTVAAILALADALAVKGYGARIVGLSYSRACTAYRSGTVPDPVPPGMAGAPGDPVAQGQTYAVTVQLRSPGEGSDPRLPLLLAGVAIGRAVVSPLRGCLIAGDNDRANACGPLAMVTAHQPPSPGELDALGIDVYAQVGTPPAQFAEHARERIQRALLPEQYR